MWSHHSHHRGHLLSLSSPSHACVLQWRDSGLKMSLSIGVKFSSPPFCHHPISSPLLSLLSTSCLLSSRLPLVAILLSPYHVCVLQWRDSGLKVLVYWYSKKLLTHLLLNSMLPLNIRDASDTFCCHGDGPSV